MTQVGLDEEGGKLSVNTNSDTITRNSIEEEVFAHAFLLLLSCVSLSRFSSGCGKTLRLINLHLRGAQLLLGNRQRRIWYAV